MKKMRIFELSKEIAIDSKDLIKIAKDLAISVESNMSMVDAHDIERIKKRVDKLKDKDQESQPTKEEDVYVQKRVGPNVIRRRARVAPQEVASTLKEVQDKPEKAKVEEEEAREPEKKEAQPDVTKAEKTIKQPGIKVQKTPDKTKAVKKKEKTVEDIKFKESIAKEKDLAGKRVPEVKPEEISATKEGLPLQQEEKALEIKAEEEKKPEEKAKKKEKKKGKKKLEDVGLLEEEGKKGIDTPSCKKVFKLKYKQVFTQKDIYDEASVPHRRKARKTKEKKATVISMPVRKKKIKIGRSITVANLAKEMGAKISDVIKILTDLGVMATQNQYIGVDEATLVATELGYKVDVSKDEIKEDFFAPQKHRPEDLKPRPPVVTVMGHVDHGKTSLLDAIRSASVTESESGGITQHIGAYQAQCKGRLITFIDTPGHEAFTSMRARGAQVTDFVVLVVAADDGVMDQTKEAINHARAAEVPILVAINKIDKTNANPKRVRQQLAELDLVSEDWGGDTVFVETSAKKRIGIEGLLEMILLQADMLELKSCPKGSAEGVVLEARMDRNRGPMCTVLIKDGRLNRGDVFVAGLEWGKVRAMFDFKGEAVQSADPSMPVEILGLNDLPAAGDTFMVAPNEKKAKEIISYLLEEKERAKAKEKEAKGDVSLDDLYNQISQGQLQQLNLIVKGDVHGSVEAVVRALGGIDTEGKITIQVIHSGIGGITENDILLASTSKAIVIGFNVRLDPKTKSLAKRDGVDIRLYNVIYDLIDDIKQALKGLLEPVYQEIVLGRAEVRNVFKVPKVGTIAGCMVMEGKIARGAQGRLLRGNEVVYDGKIDSLKRFKDDVKEVVSGYECGIGLENYDEIEEGDIIDVYIRQKQENDT
ncbi:MAG: translation initiation factor IF-2 [Deltaproteobacteria bacterium]|nr:translation initiation factor IF-2 [Deltaproteobacteria bacterium]